MIRILLVEDEPLFRKGLAKMIDGAGLGWEICGEAENGLEAEELLAKLRPDLVMTDIRMPLVDGLAFLEAGKARFPDTEFVVITGYQDFQYAQTALRSGALDMLVKPCSKQDICRTMHKAEAVLQEKEARRRRAEGEHKLLQESTLRSLFLRLPYNFEAAAELEREWRDCELLLIRIASFCPAGKTYTKRDAPLLQYAVLNIITDLLEAHGLQGQLYLIESGKMALLLRPSPEGPLFRSAVASTIRQLLGLDAVFHSCGGGGAGLYRLPDMYESVMQDGPDSQAPRGADSRVLANRASQQQLAAQLAALIGNGRTDALRCHLEQRIEEICRRPEEHREMEALSFSFGLQEAARKELEREAEPGAIADSIARLRQGGAEEVRNWLHGEMDWFLSVLLEWQRHYSTGSVTRAIRIMEERFTEPLTLQDIASAIHLNASYFSHVFKKETGRSFVQFFTDLRMEKAMQLLANTELNVTEVAGRVGYDLPNYFAKLFKQSTGLSPKEYRRKHRSGVR